jgi:hypothetical protein
MANKFVIEVRAKGFKNLEGELNRASAATKGYEKATTQLRGSTSGLRRQIGAIRNNILLYTFAIGGAIKVTSTFVRTASKFEQVRTRLVGLTGSVVKANRAFETFNAVAATTPFSLEDVADAGAQLKAFGADAEALIKPITDLAAFMGTTATEAANSFGRAFAGGAGAADILREKGILNIIKSTQGLTDLANTSLPQFRKALIETLQDPAVGIAGSTDRMSQTFQGAFSNMNDSVSRLSAEIGDTMLPSLKEAAKDIGSLADRVGDYIRSFTESEAEAMLRNLKAIGVETKALTALEVLVFKEQTVKRIDGMNKGIADILEKNPQLKATFDIFGDFDQKVKKIEGFRDLLGPIRNVTITSEKAAELLEVLGQKMNLTQIDALGMAESVGTSNQATSEATQKAKDQFMALASLVAILTQQDLVYKQLAETIAELSATAPPVLVDPKDEKLLLRQARAFKQFSDNIATAIVHGQNLGDAVVNSLRAIAAELAAQAVSFAILNMFTTGGFSASKAGFNLLGAVFPSLGHSGGAVTKDGVQAFGSGGVVRGRDNVPILAQAGEFIIKRESAQSIGLDSLRQMNETGQPSNNVVVNIHGGVVQDDYVRNELIPALNSAVNSGARIDA